MKQPLTDSKMRIVQTFWTAGQDPLKCDFGWRHAEYNLMSWALSCICLRMHYDEVALYTDEEGKHVLIDLLNLPYTEVHVVYDRTLGLSQHWAQAKMRTYAEQTVPFIHVDGDVYLSRRIPDAISHSPLVAQNREIGTGYYWDMMDKIVKHRSIRLPDFIVEGLKSETLASYNMGIFGGTDLAFIRKVCDEAFRFIDDNQMNNPEVAHSGVVCNILYEQMFFAALADREGRSVASVYGKPVKDEGYSGEKFCNLVKFDEKPFFHILGGHKQDKSVCEMLGKVLLARFPEFYLKVYRLFPEYNSRLVLHNGYLKSPLSVESCIAKYEDFMMTAEREWRSLPFGSIWSIEKEEANAYKNINSEGILSSRLRLSPYLKIFEIPEDWPEKALAILRRRLSLPSSMKRFWICMVPRLGADGVRDVGVGVLGVNMIRSLSQSELTVKEVVDNACACIKPDMIPGNVKVKLVMKEMEYLMYFGAVILRKEHEV